MTKYEMVQKMVNAFYDNPINGPQGCWEAALRVVAEEHGFVDAYWPKTLEERVTIDPVTGGNYFVVRLDGISAYSAFFGKEHAERYRLGLIQELREKETQKQ